MTPGGPVNPTAARMLAFDTDKSPEAVASMLAKLPVETKGESTTTTQPGLFHRSNHLILTQAFSAILAQHFTQGLIATASLIILDAPVGTIQTSINLWLDMAIMKAGFNACSLKLGQNFGSCCTGWSRPPGCA